MAKPGNIVDVSKRPRVKASGEAKMTTLPAATSFGADSRAYAKTKAFTSVGSVKTMPVENFGLGQPFKPMSTGSTFPLGAEVKRMTRGK